MNGLQVGEVGDERFCVYLIPETLRATTLGEKLEGDFVNIEIDSQTQVFFNSPTQMPCPTVVWIKFE